MNLLRIAGLFSALAIAGCAGVRPAPPATAKAAVGPAAPLTTAEVDQFLRSEWSRRGITPTAPVDDATFLRRASIDLVGTIPTPERVTAFLADPAPTREKRARLVAELLASDAYADHMTVVWEELLLGNSRAGAIDRAAFRAWLHEQFEKNAPWNDVAFALITATGVQSPGKVGGGRADASEAMAERPAVSGAANYPLRFRDAPQDFAGSASRVFLGTQIQCAECHDHKTEKWTQQDFRQFAASFARVEHARAGMDSGARLFAVRDLDRPAKRVAANAELAPIAKAEPRALDGTNLSGNVRQSVARWMTQSPEFSRAFVNRIWGNMLGRGFVNPVDDLRPSNPPEAGALLDRLAAEFVRSGHDVKRLIGLIAATEAYQLAPGATAGEIPLWSRFRMVPLGAEELASSLLVATGAGAELGRRIEAEDLRYQLTRLFSFDFDVDEEFEQTRYEGTLAQALVLMNGKLIAFGSSARASAPLAALARAPITEGERVDAIFLRTLSRKPSDAERDVFVRYLASPPTLGDEPVAAGDAPGPRARPAMPGKKPRGRDPLARLAAAAGSRDPKVAALEDVAWSLLNSSEFALNH